MASHGLVATGTGGTTASTLTKVGSTITLPAGGPWTVYGVWCLVALNTAVKDVSLDGAFKVESLTGDITPDPAPGLFPIAGVDSPSSANYGSAAMALSLYPVEWEASGKAQIDIYHENWNVLATAPRVAAGIIFGDAIPETKRIKFCDSVQADSTATTKTTLGTITIAEKAERITGLFGCISNTAGITADDPCIGYFQLESDDVNVRPAQFPFCRAIQPGDGTVVGASSAPMVEFIPVDIPVPGGARVGCYGYSNVAVANGASMAVSIAYE